MSLPEPTHIRELVNGGDVIIPQPQDEYAFEEAGRIDDAEGLSNFAKGSIKRLLRVIASDPGRLTLSLYAGGGPRRSNWVPLVLLSIGGKKQRVHIEKLTCSNCAWQGETANPMLSELYIDVPDEFGELRRASAFPKLPCPWCGTALPRYPIWIEPSAM